MAVFLKDIDHRDEMFELGILVDAQNDVFLPRQCSDGFVKFLLRHNLSVPIENPCVVHLNQPRIVICRHFLSRLGGRQINLDLALGDEGRNRKG